MAGVEPRFETLNGQDPVAYILSSNIARRHLTKGQRAMAVAMAVDLVSKSPEGKQLARALGMSEARLSQSKTVIKHAPELADRVLAGRLPLNDAYAQAKARKEGKDTNEARMARLQAEAAR